MTVTTEPSSRSLTANGLSLHYLEWGRPGALPVVCVHGYTSSAQAFNALARHLQDRFHVLALDVRGHGESAWSPAGAYAYADQADDVAAFADRLRLDKFLLIGTSMGGRIAMAYAAQHGPRLCGLVLNDIGPDRESGSQRITGMVGSRPEDFADLEEAMEYRRQISPITAGRPLDDQRELALGVLRQRPDGRWGWKMEDIWSAMLDAPRSRLRWRSRTEYRLSLDCFASSQQTALDARAQNRQSHYRFHHDHSADRHAGDVEVDPIMTRSDYGARSTNRYSIV